jgi:hypothetical protein
VAGRIIVHIGLQKAGTTYLQRVLQLNGEALADAGILYPVPLDWHRGRRTVANHEWATYGLLGTEYPWVSKERLTEESAGWERLLDQMRHAKGGTVLLSAEALSVIRSPAIGRFIGSLKADEIDIVITARDLGRSLPSLWQQHIRNGRQVGFAGFLRGLAEERDGSGAAERIETDLDAHVWRAFALGGLIRRWGAVVDPDRISVVTIPVSAPPSRLWTLFSEAIGVPRLAETVTTDLDDPVHTSLTAPELDVLVAVNSALEQLNWSRGPSARLRADITEGFMSRKHRGPKPAIPSSWRAQVAKWSEEDVAQVIEAGVSIVGDVSHLRYEPDQADPPSPSRDEITRTTAAAILAVINAEAPRPTSLRRRLRQMLP